MRTLSGEACHGVRQIVRFNWPFYAAASSLVLTAPLVAHHLPRTGAMRGVFLFATGLTAFWTIASLAASWLVYDRSPLMTGRWIPRALGYRPPVWISVHAGLDELSPVIRALFGGTHGRVMDVFDPNEMTEPSIARARRRSPCSEGETVACGRLPADSDSIDAVFLLLSAHELRAHEGRCALLGEVRRILRPGRRALIAEHLRDLPNVAAFGPGAWHFHSRRTWTRAFRDTGLAIADEFAVTPFVRVFVLERPS